MLTNPPKALRNHNRIDVYAARRHLWLTTPLPERHGRNGLPVQVAFLDAPACPLEDRNAHVPPLAWSAGCELDAHNVTKVYKLLPPSSVKYS